FSTSLRVFVCLCVVVGPDTESKVIRLEAFVSPSANPVPKCDLASGWMQHNSNCYKLNSDTRKSWTAARVDCVLDGGDLVSIASEAENQYVMAMMGTSKWIGLKHNPTEGGYSWSDGTPLSHTNWADGEPNNHEGREECVEMVSSTNGTYSWWNDLNCDLEISQIKSGHTLDLPSFKASRAAAE
uniref:C-type lectin domain-containing protein n=1 Tax=Salarias fasciatus TaxID=181472 RepID=A0A672J829_SALFA